MIYPIKDVPIKRIASFDKKRDGSPLITKAGKPYKKVLLEVDPNTVDEITFTGKLSMLDFDGLTDNWKEGDLLSGNIVKDGDWWNFELPKVNLKDEVEELKTKIMELEKENEELRGKLIDAEKASLTDEDLPF